MKTTNNDCYEVKVNLETQSETLPGEGGIYTNKCSRIKSSIDAFLQKNPRLSLQSIEDKTGVPSTTLRRIISLKGNPQPEAAIKIFLALGHEKELISYMQDYHSEIAAFITSKSSHNDQYDFIKDEDREFFLDEANFLILSLAYTTAGTSEDEIRYELGERGVERLNELLAKKIVVKIGTKRIVGTIQDFKLPIADVKTRIEFALKYYRLSEAGNINNWISHQTESLNEEGIKALKLLHQKQFNERREKIFENPMYLGNIKIYSSAVSSTFLAYNESGVLQ